MYAVFQIPRLALQAVLRAPDLSAAGGAATSLQSDLPPVVVVDPQARKPAVLEMTKAAEREGVLIGLSVPQALARCSELSVLHRSLQAEKSVGELLFSMAYSLSPRVERDSCGEVLVDLRGTKQAKSLKRCEEILTELAEARLQAGVGVAESCVVAALASRATVAGGLLVGGEERELPPIGMFRYAPLERFMDDMPIRNVGGSDALLDVLQKWGVHTVGAFSKLKRSAVGARLGVEGLALWDRVTGRERRIVAVAELPPEFEESWEFEYDVDSVDPLLFLLNRFLDTLSARMRATCKVATFARVELRLAYGSPIVLEQKLPEPTSDGKALFALLSARLEQVEAESPVASMRLVLQTQDFRERQLGIFESSLKNPYRFTQTLSQIAGIVGEDRVGRPVLEKDGRPDGFRLEELPAAVPPLGEELSAARLFGMPLRRFRPSRPAAIEFQGRAPIWVQCEGVSGFVKAARGPWMHSGHWWEDKGRWNRVEWDVELNKGGLYRIVKDEIGWNVEGEY
ncbi:DNA polymerase Y family protein [Pelagicoccus albus]|uniref:DNA polymerase Y family protein n=1 Tax=Pelagicoccus albus TaxID=415222 RepID=A0A7X1E844_9BACT|nr:DNA polymerase Y family protein [Pelagicoccus albus]MBC2605871.1 DNA polymerase Y family protein [Pelagicoccus albus]